jgi:hypothetical protein
MKAGRLAIWIFAGMLSSIALAAEEDGASADDVVSGTPPTQSTDQPLTVEEILNRDPKRSEYVVDERCISSSRIKSVDVIDERHVAFRMSNNEYQLVQFKRRCPELRPGGTVSYERTNNRLCRNDSIQAVRDRPFGGMERGIKCPIPGFQKVTKEQIVLLKDTLVAEKRKKREG